MEAKKFVDLETVIYPEHFAATLDGLSLEEQMGRFRTAGTTTFRSTGWSSRNCKDTHCKRLEEDSEVTAIVVSSGRIVGVMIKNWNGAAVYCEPDQGVCTYYSCDNNGAGYKEREDYRYLVCVPADFDDDK